MGGGCASRHGAYPEHSCVILATEVNVGTLQEQPLRVEMYSELKLYTYLNGELPNFSPNAS